jgi:hypothetical protein
LTRTSAIHVRAPQKEEPRQQRARAGNCDMGALRSDSAQQVPNLQRQLQFNAQSDR